MVKSRKIRACLQRYRNLSVGIVCPYCNCQIQLNTVTMHATTGKHAKFKELFLHDHPDFQQSTYLQRLNNMTKYLSKVNKDHYDIQKDVDIIMKELPNTYSVQDLIRRQLQTPF